MYGRNVGLSVSWLCMAIMGVSVVALGVDCVLVAVGVVWWLDVFYLMSYMKLVITPLKYIPQVRCAGTVTPWIPVPSVTCISE